MSAALLPFSTLRPQEPDALLALIAMHQADPRPEKIDVGVGVYRDETGQTPVMQAVKAAESLLVADQPSKAYRGAEGDIRFTRLVADLIFGAVAPDGRRFGLQTPGGTGALRVGAQLLARATPGARVWVSEPTWPNHAPIFIEAGLTMLVHPYHDTRTHGVAFEMMLSALEKARSGDVLLLHGCCHNPTGMQFSQDQWRTISALCNDRGLIPFVDLAYQGLAEGIEADGAGARLLMEAVPASLLAYSCDKNFGMYRDRVGVLFVQAPTAAIAELVRANALGLARSLWSMPPDHGAAVVRTILDSRNLRTNWCHELDGMRNRLNHMRAALAAVHPALAPVALQRGLFSRLPIDSRAVTAMRENHGIYMAADGRINIAGLNNTNLGRFIDGLLPHLPKGADAGQAGVPVHQRALG